MNCSLGGFSRYVKKNLNQKWKGPSAVEEIRQQREKGS